MNQTTDHNGKTRLDYYRVAVGGKHGYTLRVCYESLREASAARARMGFALHEATILVPGEPDLT